MMYFSNQNVNIFYKKIHCSTSTMAHTQHIYKLFRNNNKKQMWRNAKKCIAVRWKCFKPPHEIILFCKTYLTIWYHMLMCIYSYFTWLRCLLVVYSISNANPTKHLANNIYCWFNDSCITLDEKFQSITSQVSIDGKMFIKHLYSICITSG